MNDYVAGNLARERQADYLREVAHDDLVAQARRRAEVAAPGRDRHSGLHPAHRRWRALIARRAPSRLATLGDRP